jgi:cysteinyl-tRNA synthetase
MVSIGALLLLIKLDLYRADMTDQHVIPPADFVPATTVMDLIDGAITQMNGNGFVYRLENDLYFDISSFLNSLPISIDDAIKAFA